MATWRMSFRAGDRGAEMWLECLRYGVAAITYIPLSRTDLSKYPKGEPRKLWSELASGQIASLRRVVYDMAKDDTIFVKKGPTIISKGRVLGSYQFDSRFRIFDPHGVPWPHQVPVEWETDFPEISIKLGAEQSTVLLLSPKRVQMLQSVLDHEVASTDEAAFLEGEIFRKDAAFRSRNRALIQAKKSQCDFRCEACGFKFEEIYGDIGHKYIVAHHNKPLANGPAKSTLNDISLICANCHSMVHTSNPPLAVEELREIVRKHRDVRAS